MSGFIGEGDLYLDRFDDTGNSQKLIFFGNAPTFQIQENADRIERISRMKNQSGQVLDSVTNKTPAILTMTVDDIKRENLALALFGEDADYSQSAASSSTVSIASMVDGSWEDTGYTNIKNVSAVANSLTIPEGNGMEINQEAGMVKFTEKSYTADPDGVAASQTPTGAGNLTLEAGASAGEVLVLTVTVGADESSVTYTVTYVDKDGNEQTSEAIAFPDSSSTVDTAIQASEIRQIAVSGATSGAVTFGWAGIDLSEEDTVTVTLDADATSGYTVTGSTKPTIRCKLVLDGRNKVTGEAVKVTVKQALISPTEAVSFISEEFVSVGFEGSLETPDGDTSPYNVRVYEKTA